MSDTELKSNIKTKETGVENSSEAEVCSNLENDEPSETPDPNSETEAKTNQGMEVVPEILRPADLHGLNCYSLRRLAAAPKWWMVMKTCLRSSSGDVTD